MEAIQAELIAKTIAHQWLEIEQQVAAGYHVDLFKENP